MSNPKSGAVFESLLATIGMLLGLAVGFLGVRAAYPHGWVATTVALIVSALLLFALTIGGSVLGSYFRI